MSFFDSFKKSKITYEMQSILIELNIDEINQGSSQNENFLFYRNKELIKIYDRECNHNFGKLFLKGDKALCPLHGWEFDLSIGEYVNLSCSKKPLLVINENELDSPYVEVEVKRKRPLTMNFSSKKELKIRFINHACLHFEIDGKFSFASDPWIIGSAFCNGWWLAKESPSDAFNILNDCNFIYISHNHPDHLHPESLSYIRKDMPILTANFQTKSTIKILKECGFKNIIVNDFTNYFVDKESEFSIAVLKSGDFRDDSGIFFEIGEFKGLLTVDSNLLNFGDLPLVDLVASSFAGGASGFPLCFENYTQEEKEKVINRNISSIRSTNIKNIEVTKSKYFLPYAGFFTEKAKRDKYIKKFNTKNKPNDYSNICKKNNCELLDANKNQIFEFIGKELKYQTKDYTSRYVDNSSEDYLINTNFLDKNDIEKLVINYFSLSKFQDNLILDLITTSDDFEKSYERFKIDFKNDDFTILDIRIKRETIEKKAINQNKRYLEIKVRREELIDVLTNRKPWEDLSIGFQCRIYRNPNIYNSDFWYHFTNIYISKAIV